MSDFESESDAQSALVAQRIEHLTTDQKVGGSSPSERATAAAGQGHDQVVRDQPDDALGLLPLTISHSC